MAERRLASTRIATRNLFALLCVFAKQNKSRVRLLSLNQSCCLILVYVLFVFTLNHMKAVRKSVYHAELCQAEGKINVASRPDRSVKKSEI